MNEEITLKQLLLILWRGKRLIAFTTIICLLLSLLGTWFVGDEQYTSVATVQLTTDNLQEDELQNIITTEYKTEMLSQRLKDEATIEQTVEAYVPNQMDVQTIPNTKIVTLHYTDTDAENAQDILFRTIAFMEDAMSESVLNKGQSLLDNYDNQVKSIRSQLATSIPVYNELIQTNGLPELLLIQNLTKDTLEVSVTSDALTSLRGIDATTYLQLQQLQLEIQEQVDVYQAAFLKYQSLATALDTFDGTPYFQLIATPSEAKSTGGVSWVISILIGLLLGVIAGATIVLFRHYWKTAN